MGVAEKTAALLEFLSTADLERMQPAARQRLAARCRAVARMCDRIDAPRSGVLAQLEDERRAE